MQPIGRPSHPGAMIENSPPPDGTDQGIHESIVFRFTHHVGPQNQRDGLPKVIVLHAQAFTVGSAAKDRVEFSHLLVGAVAFRLAQVKDMSLELEKKWYIVRRKMIHIRRREAVSAEKAAQ